MAKNDLIGGSLWEQYSNIVSERMNNPQHLGVITQEEADKAHAKLIIADWGAEACGDAVRLYWLVDETTGKILDAKFKSFGCGTAIASSDVTAEMCIGRTVDEAVKITNLDVERAMRDEEDKPSIPPQKMHCSVMAYDVIKKAASVYKGVDMSLLEDEGIVCECARVTLRTIKDVIRINDLKTVEEITQYTKAGAFCKSCVRAGGHEERKRSCTKWRRKRAFPP
jgi:NifU-like protein